MPTRLQEEETVEDIQRTEEAYWIRERTPVEPLSPGEKASITPYVPPFFVSTYFFSDIVEDIQRTEEGYASRDAFFGDVGYRIKNDLKENRFSLSKAVLYCYLFSDWLPTAHTIGDGCVDAIGLKEGVYDRKYLVLIFYNSRGEPLSGGICSIESFGDFLEKHKEKLTSPFLSFFTACSFDVSCGSIFRDEVKIELLEVVEFQAKISEVSYDEPNTKCKRGVGQKLLTLAKKAVLWFATY